MQLTEYLARVRAHLLARPALRYLEWLDTRVNGDGSDAVTPPGLVCWTTKPRKNMEDFPMLDNDLDFDLSPMKDGGGGNLMEKYTASQQCYIVRGDGVADGVDGVTKEPNVQVAIGLQFSEHIEAVLARSLC